MTYRLKSLRWWPRRARPGGPLDGPLPLEEGRGCCGRPDPQPTSRPRWPQPSATKIHQGHQSIHTQLAHGFSHGSANKQHVFLTCSSGETLGLGTARPSPYPCLWMAERANSATALSSVGSRRSALRICAAVKAGQSQINPRFNKSSKNQ